MRITKSAGPQVGFGAMMLLMGVSSISALLGSKTEDIEKVMPVGLLLVICFLLTALGAALAFGRRGIDIDRRAGVIRIWWGFLGPLRSRTLSLKRVKAVSIREEIRTSRNSRDGRSYTVYPVRIMGLGTPLVVEIPRNFTAARRRGEEVANFLGVDLEDTSGGEKTLREAGSLDMSLREKRAAGLGSAEVPEVPKGTRVRTRVKKGKAIFNIPAPGFGFAEAGSIIFYALVACTPFVSLAVIYSHIGDKLREELAKIENPRMAYLITGGVIFVWVVYSLGMAFAMAWGAMAKETVTVGADGLRVARRGPVFSTDRRLGVGEVEEIVIRESRPRFRLCMPTKLGGACVTALGDHGAVEFGRGLSASELKWLRDSVESALA